VPQLIADLNAGLTIKAPIYAVAPTTIDRRAVLEKWGQTTFF
jgi:hypothetical protein